MPDRITYTTPDDVTIVADWQPATTTYAACVLVHMMPATRSSFAAAQTALARLGIATLAIDLRGHGESVQGPQERRIDFQSFSDEEHRTSLYDLTSAISWIKARGVPADRIFALGASFGADLCLQLLTEEPSMPGAVLLSPGRYRGLDPAQIVEDVLQHQGLYIVSAEDDAESYTASQELFEACASDEKVFQPYRTGGHGTVLLESDPKLIEKIGAWMIGRL